MDLALNNVQTLICHKTKPNQTKFNMEIAPFYLKYKTSVLFAFK